MLKFTANYSYTNSNFIIANLSQKKEINKENLQVIKVLKNILQRGSPTIMSRFLQEKLNMVDYFNKNEFNKFKYFLDYEPPKWYKTILGKDFNYNPAKNFYEELPTLLPDHPWLQQIIFPEAEIKEITGAITKTKFERRRVDFYLEPAKLVIEIDGSHHINKTNDDNQRDKFLKSHGIKTIRITTKEYKQKNEDFERKLNEISNRIVEYNDNFNYINFTSKEDSDIKSKLYPAAINRFQILLLKLLETGNLTFYDRSWDITIRNRDSDIIKVKKLFELAYQDIDTWFENLFALLNRNIDLPKLKLQVTDASEYTYKENTINIDFSLLKRWTDEYELMPNTVYLRTHYLDNIDYFQISSADLIDYPVSEEEHEKPLTFFLQNIFNKESFRKGQLTILCSALRREDTVGLLPTGGGKSLCYQLASILQPGISFVIAPLKSLMIDQKENLDKEYITKTHYIIGDQPAKERKIVQYNYSLGNYQFIWLSPERLQIQEFRNYLSTVNAEFNIAYAVIDEIHCLSEWGHDFRTSYLNLARTVRKYAPTAKFLGLTATASQFVHKDIKAEFGIDDDNIKMLISFNRPELNFKVITTDNNDKYEKLVEIIENYNQKTRLLEDNPYNKSAVVFTPHVNWIYGCYHLYNKFANKYNNKVGYFSGSVPKIRENDQRRPIMNPKDYDDYKLDIQKSFKNDRFPLLFATKAFGMGIDKPNINLTIHYGIPGSIEAFYQEAGRAGRDPNPQRNKSENFLIFSDEKKNTNELFDPNASVAFINQRLNDVGFNGHDIFRQLFFFTNSFRGIENEKQDIFNLLIKYYIQNESIIIPYDFKDKEITEKAIYRLTLLNVVKDYTINFNTNEFKVDFREVNDKLLLDGLKRYIHKYDPEHPVEREVEKVQENKTSEKIIKYLLIWIYNHIAYERRQAIKGIADLAREFGGNNEKTDEQFKNKILKYFEVNETTFLLQHIGENPTDYKKWFEVFYSDTSDKQENKLIINNIKEISSIKSKLQRFLESYRNNNGLNIISGLIRLFLDEFDDPDGKKRMESAFENISSTYKKYDQEIILDYMLNIGQYLKEHNRNELGISVLKYFPEFYKKSYYYLGDMSSLNTYLEDAITKLKTLNSKIYG